MASHGVNRVILVGNGDDLSCQRSQSVSLLLASIQRVPQTDSMMVC